MTARSILFVSPGPLAAPALAWAHEAGLDVVATGTGDARIGRHADRVEALAPDDRAGHVELARELAEAGGLAGVLAGKRDALATAAAAAEASCTSTLTVSDVERALDPLAARAVLREAGLPVLDRDTEPDARRLEAQGFFRDGAFVAGGLSERRSDEAATTVCLPASDPGPEKALYELLENGARTLGLTHGPVHAELVLGTAGPSLVEVLPTFLEDATTLHLCPLALGKSPLQAWIATLVEAGGPFDAMPDRSGPRLGPRAGWRSLHAPGPGRVIEVRGLPRARTLPGIEGARLWHGVGAFVHHEREPVGAVWGTGWDEAELGERLAAAARAIGIRVDSLEVA